MFIAVLPVRSNQAFRFRDKRAALVITHSFNADMCSARSGGDSKIGIFHGPRLTPYQSTEFYLDPSRFQRNGETND